jgi:phage terminase large subunit
MKQLRLLDKYKPLFVNPPSTRYFVITGSRGSGKSYSVTLFLLNLTYENGHVILFTRWTLTSAFISIIPEFIDKIGLLGKEDDFEITQDMIINKVTGSKILFRGIKTSQGTATANLKSISGVTTFIVEEAEELVDSETFSKIDLSVRDKIHPNRVLLILNPTNRRHWIYQRFYASCGVQPGFNGVKDDVTYIHTTYLDNKINLSDSFITQAELTKERNPKKYDHIFLGNWQERNSGVIFEYQLGNYESQGIDIWGIDWGFSVDPTALCKVSIDKSNKKLYLKEELYSTRLGLSDLEVILKDKVGRGLIYADSADPRLISDLRRSGLNLVPAIKKAGSILEGIKILQDYTLIVDPSSINLINELDQYSWKESGLPHDEHNHLIDAIRMAVSMATKNVVKKYSVG